LGGSIVKGNLVYWVREGKGRLKSIRLTVCSEKDSDVLNEQGVVQLRRQRVQRLLDEAKVACNSGAGFSASHTQYVRLNFGTSEDNIEEAVTRIGRLLS